MRLIPLHLIPHDTAIGFMGQKWAAFALSLVLVLGSFALLFTKGLNFGIDFTGGVVMEIRTSEPVDLGKIRALLSHREDLGEVLLQRFGSENDVMIRFQPKGAEEGAQAKAVNEVKSTLAALPTEIEYRRVDYVGPQVGRELIQAGALSVALSLLAIMAYIWFRFEWQYGVGGILALVHDAVVTLGFFSLAWLEFNLTSVAAILTIIGYSINDSVVIYDRIRENLRKYKKMPLDKLLNNSINETLSRTMMTVGTVVVTLLALVFMGGPVLRDFSVAILFGILIGTYSSVYISVPILIFLNLRKNANSKGV